jgi:cell division protein ZipA
MDADTLRITLAVFGALVLGGLYFWERRRRTDDEEEEYEDFGEERDDTDREPRLGTWNEADETAADPSQPALGSGGEGRDTEVEDGPVQPEFELEPPPAPPVPAPPEFPPGPMILQLYVTASGDPFEGADIVHAAGRCGLEPGEMDIFHCALGDGDDIQTLFSMANMVKPGTFPFGAMAEFQSPGLTLFAQYDGTPDDPGRMEEMLGTAHSLADDLGGEVRDESRAILTSEGERRLRERVMAFVQARLASDAAP